VIFFLVVMFGIGGVVVLVPLALLPLSIGIGLYARWHLMRATEEQAKSANRKNGVLIEAIDGIEAIKKLEKDGLITEDDLHRSEKEIQSYTDKKVIELDQHIVAKEKEIMTV
jgi:ABC-type bacteriocin/lantibiotic exporter with double-glycine peptidase domain